MRPGRKITEGQRARFIQQLQDAARNAADACLQLSDDQDAWWRVIQRGEEFIAPLTETAVGKTKSIIFSNKYEGEEVISDREYPATFKGPKPIEAQIEMLADIFKLSPDAALAYAKKNAGQKPSDERAEGWYAVPSLEALISKLWPNVKPMDGYCRATNLVLQKLAASRPFFNNREGQVTERNFRREKYSANKLSALAEEQQGSKILILAVQFGKRHRGRSVLRALESFSGNEFGLGAFEVGCLALTHPERFADQSELGTDCLGDQVSLKSGDEYNNAPCFVYRGNRLEFDVLSAGGHGITYGLCGGVSGFTADN